MADRTPTTGLTVPVEVRDEVNAFIKQLAELEGCDTTQGQLIGALIHGTTPGLAAYMVKAYVMHKAKPGPGGPSGDDDLPESVSPPELQG